MKTAVQKKKRKPSSSISSGPNYRRAQAIAKYYDQRKGEDLIGADNRVEPANMPVWMEVPVDLVPEVRKMIARFKKSA